MAITRAQQARQMYKEGSKKPVVQGGVDNYLGDQPQVVVPRKWQSGPDKPPTELAYITEAEKKLLLKEDIHGSLKEGPNEGPAGIMSLDSFGDIGGAGAGGADTDAGGGYDTGSGGGGFTGKGGGESPADFKARVAKETAALNKAVKDQEDYFKSEEFKKEKKENEKLIKDNLKRDKKRRQERIQNIFLKNKNFLDPRTRQFVDLSKFGLTPTQLADLKAAGLYDEEKGLLSPELTSSALYGGLPESVASLFEKSDKFSGAEMEAFKEKFNMPDMPGLLGLGLNLASPFLQKGSRKTKDFFTDDVLGAGKFTYKGQVVTPEMFQFLSPTEMQEVYGNYMDRRMGGDIDAYGNPIPQTGGRDDTPMDPCKGPNPPAYCFVNQDQTETETETSKRNLGGLAPRFAGSIFDFTGLADGGRAGMMDGGMMDDDPTGGIMDLETGRQMYFLGKLVKKAKRAVKKVVKSPFGKAALGYALTGGLGNLAGGSGLGGMFKGFMSPSKFLAKESLANIFTKGGAKNILFGGQKLMGNPAKNNFVDFSGILGSGGKFSLGKGLTLGFGIPMALDLLGVGKDDDKKMNLDEYYKTQGIDVDYIRRHPFSFSPASQMGSLYNFADGGRTGYQEGGDAEPVAKKTMPLIDMDGKEKDYRETGGFVDMGRMERADDVPARLSKNEFVFTADAVRNAGEGDIDKGAEVMYNMMKNLEAGGEVSEESQGLEGAREMFKTSQRLGEVI
jgi:hypothetical protein